MAIGHAHDLRTLTLRTNGQFPNNELNVFLGNGTKINLCEKSVPFKDMTVDCSTTVTYHELGGLAVADSISEQC